MYDPAGAIPCISKGRTQARLASQITTHGNICYSQPMFKKVYRHKLQLFQASAGARYASITTWLVHAVGVLSAGLLALQFVRIGLSALDRATVFVGSPIDGVFQLYGCPVGAAGDRW
jgi:hypothetical protein